MIDKGVCNKGFISNLSYCECECNKLCDVSEYLDYENCKCRKELVDKLVEEYTETRKKVKLVTVALAEHESRGWVQFFHTVHGFNFATFYN